MEETGRVASNAVVPISMFSGSVSAETPRNLLVSAGEWEARLAALLGKALQAARYGLDASFERRSEGPVAQRGGWIVLLLAATINLGWPLARALPAGTPPGRRALGTRRFLVTALLPAGRFRFYSGRWTRTCCRSWWPITWRCIWGSTGSSRWGFWRGGGWRAVSGQGLVERGRGGAIRHRGRGRRARPLRRLVPAASGTGGRDRGTGAGRDPLHAGRRAADRRRRGLWRVVVARGAFLASLALAVVLDIKALVFLIIILPVIVLYFLLFGTMSGWVGRRTGLPAAAGLGLGLVLAWALGVTFPMFDAGSGA